MTMMGQQSVIDKSNCKSDQKWSSEETLMNFSFNQQHHEPKKSPNVCSIVPACILNSSIPSNNITGLSGIGFSVLPNFSIYYAFTLLNVTLQNFTDCWKRSLSCWLNQLCDRFLIRRLFLHICGLECTQFATGTSQISKQLRGMMNYSILQ